LQISSSLPEGDLNSQLALNYRVKLVQDTSTPTAEQPAVPIASLRSSYFAKSNDRLISAEAVSSQTPKRLSNPGRKTKRLQNKCLVDLHRKLVPHSKDGPYVCGEPHHCNRFGCWSHDGFAVTKSGTDAAGSPSGDVAHLPDKPKLLSSVVEANEPCAHQGPLAPPLPFDFTKHTCAKRTSDKSHWQLPNTKSISSKKNPGGDDDWQSWVEDFGQSWNHSSRCVPQPTRQTRSMCPSVHFWTRRISLCLLANVFPNRTCVGNTD
jgi:hypothetical protein